MATRIRQCGGDVKAAVRLRRGTPSILHPDGPGEAISTFRLVGYSVEMVGAYSASWCENGSLEFPVDTMAVRW